MMRSINGFGKFVGGLDILKYIYQDASIVQKIRYGWAELVQVSRAHDCRQGEVAAGCSAVPGWNLHAFCLQTVMCET